MTNEIRNSKFEIRIKSGGRNNGARVFRSSAFGPRNLLCWLALALLLAALGCAADKKQRLLAFFFDGVPSPGSVTNAPRVEYDENGKPLDRVVLVQANLTPAPRPKFVAHPPYEDHKCNECHESRFSVKMKGP